MSVTADRVIVELEAKIDRYNADVRRAEREFREATDRINRGSNAIATSTAGAMRAVGAALAGVSLVALAKQFLDAAEASKQMEAQLRLATRTFGTFGQAQEDVERLAAATRGGLTETASLYGNLLRATQTLGGSQAEAARATETFSKALKIGGADTQSAASATLQFGQALASGVLRGDEFNSIAEASPRILQLLADAIGKPAGELRALAADGKLTSDILFKALTDRRFTAGIDEEFRGLPVTFGDAMQQVSNAAVLTFGAFDRGGEFSSALASFVADGSSGLSDLGDTAEQVGIEIRSTFAGLSDAFSPLVDGAKSAFELIGGDSRSLVQQIRDDLSSLFGAFDKANNLLVSARNFETNEDNAIKGVINKFIVGAGGTKTLALKPTVQPVGLQETFDRSSNASRRRGEALARQRAAEIKLNKNGFTINRRTDGSYDETTIRRRVNPPAQPRTVAPTKKKAGPKGPSAETLANRVEAERQKALRNDEAFESEKFSLNQDLLRARRMTAAAADTVAQLEVQEIEAARDRQNASYQREVAEKKLTQARADELVALNNKVAAERVAAVNAERAERQQQARASLIESDLNNARDLEAANGALADTAEKRRQSALRLLDLEYQLERARLKAVVQAKATNELEVAQQEAARRRLALLPQLQAADTAAVNRQNEGPLASFRRGLDDPKSQVEQAVADKLAQVDQGITDAIANKLGIKDPLLRQLLKTFIEQQVLKPLYDSIAGAGGQGGGAGGILGTIAGLFSSGSSRALPSRASGGYVGAGQLVRVNEASSPGNVEGFRPMGSGTVIPLGQMKAATSRGAAQVVQHIHVDARNSVTPAGFARDLLDQANGFALDVGRESASRAVQAGPGRLSRYQTLEG